MYPISNRPKITQQDIARGYVSRYFVKYLSSKKIVEVDKQQYFKFVTNTSYQTIEIKWIIGGYDNDTLVNRDQILYGAETQNKNQKEIYNQIMPGVARMLPNPLEYFSGKRIPQFTEKTLEIPETIESTVVNTYPPTIAPSLVPGFVLYYDAGDTDSYPGYGDAIKDLGPYGYNTTIIQLPTHITFDDGNGGNFKFNPGTETSGNYASIPLPVNSNMPWNNSDITAMTLSFWTKFSTVLSTSATLFGYDAGIGGGRFQLVYNGTYMVVNRATIAQVGVFSDYVVVRDTITNIVLTKSNSQYSLYINGALVSQFTSAATYTVGSPCLGQNYNPGFPISSRAVEKMNGSIYNFIAYNTALTPAEVLQNYNVHKSRFGL